MSRRFQMSRARDRVLVTIPPNRLLLSKEVITMQTFSRRRKRPSCQPARSAAPENTLSSGTKYTGHGRDFSRSGSQYT